jgi:plasmid stability protein
MGKSRNHPDKVEFRWRQHEAQWQDRLADAAAQAGRTVGDHAREVLKAALMSEGELSHELHMLREEISGITRILQALTPGQQDRRAESPEQPGREADDRTHQLLKTSLKTQTEQFQELRRLREQVSTMTQHLGVLAEVVGNQRATHENLYQLRDALANVAVKLLTDLGQLTPEQALDWVHTTFDAE